MIEMTDHDAPVWNAAIEAAIGVARNGRLVPPDGGSPTDGERAVCDAIEQRLRGLIRPELSAAEMDAAGERIATAIRAIYRSGATGTKLAQSPETEKASR